MNTKQKKALYESIMKSVAKTVKKALNEMHNINYYDEAGKYANELYHLWDNGKVFTSKAEDEKYRDMKDGFVAMLTSISARLEHYASCSNYKEMLEDAKIKSKVFWHCYRECKENSLFQNPKQIERYVYAIMKPFN